MPHPPSDNQNLGRGDAFCLHVSFIEFHSAANNLIKFAAIHEKQIPHTACRSKRVRDDSDDFIIQST